MALLVTFEYPDGNPAFTQTCEVVPRIGERLAWTGQDGAEYSTEVLDVAYEPSFDPVAEGEPPPGFRSVRVTLRME